MFVEDVVGHVMKNAKDNVKMVVLEHVPGGVTVLAKAIAKMTA